MILTRRSLLQSSLAVPALLLPRPSLARRRLSHIGGGGASGGGGGYVAKAVHFDGATWLRNGSLAAPITPSVFSYSLWIKLATYSSPGNGIVFVVDPENNYQSFAQVNATNNTPPSSFSSVVYDQNGSTAHRIAADTNVIVANLTWHNIVCTVTTDQIGTNIIKLYVDRIDVTSDIVDVGSPFTIAFDSLSFWFGNDGSAQGIMADFADVWIAPGVSLLTGSSISSATLDKFQNSSTGKPVDPSGFPAGGVILFSGDAASFGNNQLTGGPFTLTGTLTNATTSPSD